MWEKKSKRITKYKKKHVTCDVRTTQCEDGTIKCKGTTKCEKRTVTYDIGTTQYEDGIVKCEKKVRKPPNVRKEQTHVMLKLHNMKIEPLNVIKN